MVLQCVTDEIRVTKKVYVGRLLDVQQLTIPKLVRGYKQAIGCNMRSGQHRKLS